MSASREKKQRQNAGPAERELKQQKERSEKKKKAALYSVVGVVVAALVLALLVWNSGFFQARAAAATVGGKTLTTAQLSYYYNDIRRTFVMYGYDTSTPDAEQVFNAEENQTYRDYFLDSALTNAQTYFALADEAVKQGHTEAEVKDSVKANIDSVKSAASSYGYSYKTYLKAMYGEYMTPSVYEGEVTRAMMASLVRGEKYNELFDGYSQEELDAYYQEHKDELDTIEYSCLTFAVPTVDSKDKDGNDLPADEVTKLTDEAKAETKKKAEEALEAVKGGATFKSQVDKYELTGSASGERLTAVGTGSINSAYSEKLMKLDKDAPELVEDDENGTCYVIAFHSRFLDSQPTRKVRHILALAENTVGSDGKLVAPTDEAWAAAKAKMDDIQAAWNATGKTEDDFSKLAGEQSDDSGSKSDGGLIRRIATDGRYVPEFQDWVYQDHQPGDVSEPIQHAAGEGATSGYYGYHLIYYVGDDEPVWKGTVRDALASDATTQWMDGLTAGYPTATTGGADYLGK